MLARLALLFIVVPLIELMLLIQMGRWVGLVPTLSVVVLTGLVGAWLARLEGTRTLQSYRAQLAHGSMPGQAVMDGLCILIGGAFLLTPGLLTDVVGFSLLLPPSRRWMQARIRRRLEEKLADGSVHFSMFRFGDGWSGATGSGFGPPFDDPFAEAPIEDVEVIQPTDELSDTSRDDRP